MTILITLGSIALGIAIGLAFGVIQRKALEQNTQKQNMGNLNSGWSVMPGSFRRVAYLILSLLAIQIICPVLFENETTQWLISAGVVIGYGLTFLQYLRTRNNIYHSIL